MAGDGWTLRSVDELKAPTNGAIAIGPFGSRMKSDCYVSSGVPVIRGNNIGDTRELVGEMVYITPELANQLGNAIVYADDLVFPHRGAIGQVGIVPRDNTERYALSSSLMKLTCDRRQVEPLFLFYFFRSTDGQHELLKNASTVGTPGIGQPLSSLRSIKIPLPPLPEQNAIAHILGTLDDKIELNRRMNATLEAMARALFQSWFVDFDPVRAKLDGRPPAGLDDTTTTLFPAHFQASPLGPIPQGWEATTLGEACERGGGNIQTGPFGTQLHASDYVEEGIPSIMPSDLRDNRISTDSISRIREQDANRLSVYRVRTGDVVYSRRGDVERRSLIRSSEDGWLCGTGCLRVRFGSQGLNPLYGAAYLGTPEARAWVVRHAVGATMPNLNTSILSALPLVVPPPALQSRFAEIVGPWDGRGTIALQETATLTVLRDTLLPKLLSGELRVADIDELAHSSSGTDG